MPPERDSDDGEDEEESTIMIDAWRVPRGRCLSCSSCSLWRKATGPFAHLTCNRCKCRTAEHEDLGAWLREVLEHSTPTVEAKLISKGIPKKAYTCWSPLETLFHLETNKAFHPSRDGRAAKGSACRREEAPASVPSPIPQGPLCSVICPTTAERHAFHPLLYHCFRSQSYEPRELVVIDTGPKPSSFLAEKAQHDPSLVYRWFKDGRWWSIGLKRNLACFLAQGELIAHFDDDDLYSPDYLSFMNSKILQATSDHQASDDANNGEGGVPRLAGRLLAATLTSWHVFDTDERTFRFLHAVSDKWVYGWGFSFAYTKDAWKHNFFPYKDVGEDFDFLMALRRLPDSRVLKVEDEHAFCSHTYHPRLSISGGEKRRDGTANPIGQEVQPPDAFVELLPLLFEADARALRDAGKKPPPAEERDRYFVLGTWDGWSTFTELIRTGSKRVFTAQIPIPTVPSMQEFQVCVNQNPGMSYYPSAKGPILGPWRCPGMNWKVSIPNSRNAISVHWDPSGDRSLTCSAVVCSVKASQPRPDAAAPKGQPRTAKAKIPSAVQAPKMSRDQALEMQTLLITEFMKEKFQASMNDICRIAGSDKVRLYQMRQDLCLPIQGPILAKFGFEASRKGVAQSVTAFNTADWARDEIITRNNEYLAWLTTAERGQVPS